MKALTALVRARVQGRDSNKEPRCHLSGAHWHACVPRTRNGDAPTAIQLQADSVMEPNATEQIRSGLQALNFDVRARNFDLNNIGLGPAHLTRSS